MRDPLSVNPVVLGPSKIPQVISGYFNQQVQLEQQRRQEDANKMSTLSRLGTVDAMGWEQDQRTIDKMKDDHFKQVTKIMLESDGKPNAEQLRSIQRGADMIKTVAAKSVADKKEYEGWVSFIRNKFDKLEYGEAAKALEDNYKNTPIFQRGAFNIDPFIKPEETKVDIFKPFNSMDVPYATKVFEKDGKRSLTQTVDPVKFQSAVKERVMSGGVYEKAFKDALQSGTVKDIDGFATMIYNDKAAQLRLRNEYKENDGTEVSWNDNIRLPDGTFASGWMINEKQAPFRTMYDGEVVDLDPMAKVVQNGEEKIVGTIKKNIPSVNISEDDYQDLPAAEKSKFEPAGFDTYGNPKYRQKGTGKTVYVPVVMPYDDVRDSFDANVKGNFTQPAKKVSTTNNLPSWAIAPKK